MRSKALRRRIVVLSCAGVGVLATGQAAARAQPQPEPSPARAAVRPEAPPGAQAPQPVSTYSAPSGSAASGSSSSPTARTYLRPVPVAHSRAQARVAVRRHATVPKADPPKLPLRPVRSLASWASRGQLLATSADGLAGTSSSGQSLLLLLVGLGLVVLVVGETTFLRRAARAPRSTGGADEPLPIRRVQLRR